MQGRKMKNNCLIWLLGITIIFSFLSTTNGIFFPFVRPFHYSIFREQNLNKANQDNDVNHLAPFPPFFAIFRRQSFNPFGHLSNEDKEIKENKTNDSSVKHEDKNFLLNGTKGNISLDNIINNVTKQVKNEINTTQVIRTIILDKFPVLRRYYDPFYPFRHFHSRRSENEDKKIEKHEQTMKPDLTNSKNISKIGVQQALSLNSSVYGTETTTNNLLLVNKDNCTHRHFIRRYLFVWRLNWTSFAVQFTMILLILTVVILGVFLCKPYCLEEKYKVHFTGKSLHI